MIQGSDDDDKKILDNILDNADKAVAGALDPMAVFQKVDAGQRTKVDHGNNLNEDEPIELELDDDGDDPIDLASVPEEPPASEPMEDVLNVVLDAQPGLDELLDPASMILMSFEEKRAAEAAEKEAAEKAKAEKEAREKQAPGEQKPNEQKPDEQKLSEPVDGEIYPPLTPPKAVVAAKEEPADGEIYPPLVPPKAAAEAEKELADGEIYPPLTPPKAAAAPKKEEPAPSGRFYDNDEDGFMTGLPDEDESSGSL